MKRFHGSQDQILFFPGSGLWVCVTPWLRRPSLHICAILVRRLVPGCHTPRKLSQKRVRCVRVAWNRLDLQIRTTLARSVNDRWGWHGGKGMASGFDTQDVVKLSTPPAAHFRRAPVPETAHIWPSRMHDRVCLRWSKHRKAGEENVPEHL